MAKKEAKKFYVFRPDGEDEGYVARLTEAEADKIQERLDAIELKSESDPPYYIYEMDYGTAADINGLLDEAEAGEAAVAAGSE
jgi:hypothetical protein